ncbi:MAG: glycoside hydrolase family 127 protein [Bacteroidia bacterium]|nr:glycoside hydrolase family 127 protein [Bacteroidia bacterium]
MKLKTKLSSLIFFGIILSASAFAQSHYPGQHSDKLKIKETAPMKAYAFDLQDVKLLDSRFKENMERESAWILSIDVNSLLHSFRTNVGLSSGLEGGYDTIKKLAGWESLDCELRGHTTGHILSGLALLYASTGNETYKVKSDSIVKGLAEVQKSLNQNSYLSAFPQNLIDRNIAGKPVWAPWYTLHKIYSGLIDQYLYCNNRQALEVVEKMAMWAHQKLATVTPEQRKVMIRNEFGGVNDSFYTLYEITGKPEYKSLAEFFYHEETLDPLMKQEDNLKGKHANTYIPKLIGLARAYEIGEPEKNKTIADFFWNTVIDHHSFCTGSNSDRESFFEPDHQSAHLTGLTGESCNVYNMLKLTRHLFCLKGDEKYADYYEKALYNHILGQQDPATGMIAYFLPMLPGGHKVYSTRDSSFWCCVGTGFENQAKYGEAIYYHNDKGLFVNLFIASELTWKSKGLKVRQETKFPAEETTRLTFEIQNPVGMPLYFRYPSWATSGSIVKINGKTLKVKQNPGSYITIDRIWKNGDKLEVTFPMKLQLSTTPDNPDVVSVSYGPIVLAAKMGTAGMQKPAPYSNPKLHNDYYTYDYHVPATLSNVLNVKGKPVTEWLKPVERYPLTFKTFNIAEGIEFTFVPLFDLHRERYIVYWKLK